MISTREKSRQIQLDEDTRRPIEKFIFSPQSTSAFLPLLQWSYFRYIVYRGAESGECVRLKLSLGKRRWLCEKIESDED